MKSFAYCRYSLLLIKIFSLISYVNLLYSIINLDSWRCPVLKYLSVSCIVLVGGHCLSTNLTHPKGIFLTFLFNFCYRHIGFLGGQEWGAYLLSKCQRINIENKFSNKESFEEFQFRYSKGIKDAIKPRFWELISRLGFSPMGGVNLEIGMIKEIVAKALDGQRYPCPAYVGCGWS